jgi:hypothetical protein
MATSDDESSLFDLLCGFRQDLDLHNRWWHRLAQVVYCLVVLGVAATLVLDGAGGGWESWLSTAFYFLVANVFVLN